MNIFKTYIVRDFKILSKYFKNEYDDIINIISPNNKYLKRYKPLIIIFFENDSPIGIIVIDIPNELHKSVFFDIYVSKKYRGKGYGEKMFKHIESTIIQILKKLNKYCIFATVNKNNKPSIKLLTKKLKFKILSGNIQKFLRERNVLNNDEIRLIKCYF